MFTNQKIVYFWEWCNTCKHLQNDENEEPCSTCIAIAARENSHKPEKWEPAEKKGE